MWWTQPHSSGRGATTGTLRRYRARPNGANKSNRSAIEKREGRELNAYAKRTQGNANPPIPRLSSIHVSARNILLSLVHLDDLWCHLPSRHGCRNATYSSVITATPLQPPNALLLSAADGSRDRAPRSSAHDRQRRSHRSSPSTHGCRGVHSRLRVRLLSHKTLYRYCCVCPPARHAVWPCATPNFSALLPWSCLRTTHHFCDRLPSLDRLTSC